MIVQKDKDELLVDVGGKSEGVLPFRELSLAIDPKGLKVGDTLEVMIHRIDDMDGTLFLSERRARALKTWEKVIEAHERDEVIEATVTQVVKGGVLVDLGMRGFVPASQIRRQPVGNLDELVGQRLRLKVIDLDHKRHRVVLSQRLVLEEELQAKKQELLGHARSRTDSRRRRRASRRFRRVRRPRRHRRPDPQQRTLVRAHQAPVRGRQDRRRRQRRDHEVRCGSEEGQPLAQARAARSVGSSTPTSSTKPTSSSAQVVKVTPNYLLVEIIPGILAMVPKGEFDAAAQYSPGQEIEVTLLTINHATRRITASIQHVADIPPEEIEKYEVLEEIGTIGDVTPAAFDAAPDVEAEAAPEGEPAL